MAANPNWNELATTTLNLWGTTKFANVFTSSNALLAMLRMNGRIQTGGLGIKILEPLMYADAGGPQWEGVVDGYTEMVPSETTGFTAAEYAWAEYRIPVSIETLKMKQQGSDTQKINLLDTYKDIAVKKLMERLSTDFWAPEGNTGASGNTRQRVGSVLCYFNRGGTLTTNTNLSIVKGAQLYSGTNGGPAVGTNPITNVGNIERNAPNGAFWCTPVLNPGSPTTLSLLGMNYTFQQAVREDDKPDYIVTTHDNYGNLMAILQGLQRYMTGKLATVGFDSMTFRGAEMVADDRCPAGNTLMLNTDYLKLRAETMKPKFEPVQDPWRSIVGWKSDIVLQLTSGNLGRVHVRNANML